MFVKFEQNLWDPNRDIWDEVFMIANTVKTGQSFCLTVICSKRSALEMKIYFIVVSVSSKISKGVISLL